MKENVIKTKSFAFAVRIVNVYKFLISEKKEFVNEQTIINDQERRLCTYREARSGKQPDFIHSKWELPRKNERNNILA